MENATPMLRQYLEIKKRYPGTILFFRLGDFYELFNEDAITGSRELGITLTARQKDSANPIPMCGVPHHAAASYIAKLVKKGYRVAICEQSEPAAKGVKLVKREVVRVITPGTAVDPQLIETRESVYLAAVCGSGTRFGAAFLDLSTGDFTATEFDGPGSLDRLRECVEGFDPREILIPLELQGTARQLFGSGANVAAVQQQLLTDSSPIAGTNGGRLTVTVRDESSFSLRDCESQLKEHFSVRELAPFGLDNHNEAIRAA